MAQTVTIIRDFALSDNTVVEWERKYGTEYVVARHIMIEERPLKNRLHTGEQVLCTWGSGTYCTTKDGAMRIAIAREREALQYLEELYAEELTPVENPEEE